MKKWIKNWFSNYIPNEAPFCHEGIEYRTVEAYFQAQKTMDPTQRAHVASLTPSLAKRYCQRRAGNFTLRSDWDTYRHTAMEYALRQKFAPGTKWHKRLMETQGEIVEWTNWNDKYWGRDVDTKEGQNHLGKLLMKIRDEI